MKPQAFASAILELADLTHLLSTMGALKDRARPNGLGTERELTEAAMTSSTLWTDGNALVGPSMTSSASMSPPLSGALHRV